MGKKSCFGRFVSFFSRDSEKKIYQQKESIEKQQAEACKRVSTEPIKREASTSKDRILGVRHESFRIRFQKERAATCIQKYYRGYLARKALHSLRAVVRLQALVRGQRVRRRAMETMRCMQALVGVQDRVRSQRIQLAKSKMVDEEEKKMTTATQGDDNSNAGNERWEPQQKRKDEQWIMREAQLQLDAASIRLERAQAQARASIYHQRQWPSEMRKGRWGWDWLDHWMYQPWQQGLMAPPPPQSPYHQSDMAPEIDVGRSFGHRRSAEYPDRAHYIFPDQPVGLARHSSDCPSPYRRTFPDQQALDGSMQSEGGVAMAPSYMAPTQSAKAKVVRGHGSVKLQSPSTKWTSSSIGNSSLNRGGGGNTPVYQVPRSPFPQQQTQWPTDFSPDFIGAIDQTPPHGLHRRRRIDFG